MRGVLLPLAEYAAALLKSALAFGSPVPSLSGAVSNPRTASGRRR